ncbi:MAG: hypothetical protein KDB14_31865 [Planctomycetales bacterium]|nr:hypothetical protein [Planctomycetales bacterium]
MNFLSHAYRHLNRADSLATGRFGPSLERPYFLAGTAVPDWLSVLDRRIRAHSSAARPYLNHGNHAVRDLAGGVIQHHADDRWFHRSRAFMELNLRFTGWVKQVLPNDRGFRTGFLGHILVELLLDAEMSHRQPTLLDRYYATIERLEPQAIADGVSQITGKDASGLAHVVTRFCHERFLDDYVDDDRLLLRLNHVMARVGLRLLPDSIQSIFGAARATVANHYDALLSSDDAIVEADEGGASANGERGT